MYADYTTDELCHPKKQCESRHQKPLRANSASYNKSREELGKSCPTLTKETMMEKATRAVETRLQKETSQPKKESQKRVGKVFVDPIVHQQAQMKNKEDLPKKKPKSKKERSRAERITRRRYR